MDSILERRFSHDSTELAPPSTDGKLSIHAIASRLLSCGNIARVLLAGTKDEHLVLHVLGAVVNACCFSDSSRPGGPMPRRISFLAGFAQPKTNSPFQQSRASSQRFCAKPTPRAGFVVFHVEHCTNSGHGLVDERHSVDFTRDKSARFCLTLKFKGVKTHSFFDNF
jgi:hypothetical protein